MKIPNRLLFLILTLVAISVSLADKQKLKPIVEGLGNLTTQQETNKDSKGETSNMFGSPNNGKVKIIKSKIIKSEVNANNDSVFYLNITKRHGWPEGIGTPLRREELSHIPVYYVLSNKNSAGKWTYMRAYDSYGNLTTNHSWGAYILNQNNDYDSGANPEWVDKLKTVCQWEYIGDSNGNEVIQERALDKDKNIVFCYNIVKVTENKKDGSSIYSGSYTDAFALPIFMRTDSTGGYKGQANFVQVKRDSQGYETLFSFTDETGHVRMNKDGAYQTAKEYDANGIQIREASLDLVGNQMIDFYGNCGWLNETDNYGNILKANYFGKENEPIRMSGTMGSNQVYGYEFKYDNYHRETDRWYLDSLKNRDINEYGVYHTVSEYNEHGERVRLSHYDKDGNLIGSDEYGIAKVITEFDNRGNLLLLEWRDKNNLLVNGYGDFCKRIMNFDKNGETVCQIDYKTINKDSIVPSFEYINDGNGNEMRYWYTNGYFRTDSVDIIGRQTQEAWYNLDNTPVGNPTDDKEAWQKYTVVYDDIHNIKIENWLDSDGDHYFNSDYNLSNKYNQAITEFDSVNNIKTSTQYLYPFGLAQKFCNQFDSDGNIISQWDITPYGEQTRVGWWNNLHYKCKVNYTMYGEMMDMIGINEFDEPSYLIQLNDNGPVYHYSDLDTYYDEYLRVIPADSMANFKNKLPKAFCIEVTDTTIAYPLGLRNNDIILSYGDWFTSEDLRSNLNYFYLETILKNALPKKIKILRHDLNTKLSSIYEFDLPEGKPSELGFYPHQLYYTEKEAKRLHDTCKLYNFIYGSSDVNSGKQILMGVQLKGGLIQTRFYHFPIYDYKDPGLLLYASEKYSESQDTWSVVSDDIDLWVKNDMYNSNFSGVTDLFFTQDFKSFKKLSKKRTQGNRGLQIVPISVSDEVFERLTSYYYTVDEIPKNQEMNKQNKATPRFKEKQIIGTWNTEFETDEYNINFTLDIGKKNNANITMQLHIEGEITSGVTMKIIASFTNFGIWTLLGNELILDLTDSHSQLDGIEIEGANEEQQKEIMEKFGENETELLGMLASIAKEVPISKIILENVTKSEVAIKLGGNDFILKRR